MLSYFNTSTEEGILRVSIAATILMAIFGIVTGLMAESSTIIYDSIYEMIDAGMTILALVVTRLIIASTAGDFVKSRLAQRFTMGFWHLEPIVLGMNGLLLISASVYALINAINHLIAGGHRLLFEYAIVYSVVSLCIETGMMLLVTRKNRIIRSDFLSLDAKGWLISVLMSIALLVTFLFGEAIEGGRLDWVVPYIDPAILILVCIVIIPMPVSSVRQAFADILLVTPAELKHKVDEIAEELVTRYGFETFHSYVAKVGRSRQIELYFVVPRGWPARPLEEWDKIRDEISEAVGGDTPDRWMTIVFTTDPEWAE